MMLQGVCKGAAMGSDGQDIPVRKTCACDFDVVAAYVV